MHYEELLQAREFMKLPPLITIKDLKKRYRELTKTMHPDRGGSIEDMQELSESYSLLLSYMENYRFKLDQSEFAAQFPFENYKSKFKF